MKLIQSIKLEYLYFVDRLHWWKTKIWFNIYIMSKFHMLIIKKNMYKILEKIQKLVYKIFYKRTVYYTVESAYEKLGLICPSYAYINQVHTNVCEYSDILSSGYNPKRQTGRTTLLLVQALVESQYSNVVVVSKNHASCYNIKKLYQAYAAQLNLSTNNLVGVIAYDKFIDKQCSLLRGYKFAIPFVDHFCDE